MLSRFLYHQSISSMTLMLTVHGSQLTMEKALTTFFMYSICNHSNIYSMKEKYIMHKTQNKNKTYSFLYLLFISFPYSWWKFLLKSSHLRKHVIEKCLFDIRFAKINPANVLLWTQFAKINPTKVNPALINPL